MINHYKNRVWALIPRRIDDSMYSDILFSNVTSIRGFECFQLFSYKYSKFEIIELMNQEVNTPESYEDVIISVGVP